VGHRGGRGVRGPDFFLRKSLDTYLRVLKPDCKPPGPIGNILATATATCSFGSFDSPSGCPVPPAPSGQWEVPRVGTPAPGRCKCKQLGTGVHRRGRGRVVPRSKQPRPRPRRPCQAAEETRGPPGGRRAYQGGYFLPPQAIASCVVGLRACVHVDHPHWPKPDLDLAGFRASQGLSYRAAFEDRHRSPNPAPYPQRVSTTPACS
jgi:hypothetical protein